MKQGRSLTQLAQRLEEIRNTAKDFVVPVKNLEMTPEGNLAFAGANFAPNSWASQQIAGYADIPQKYYDRIRTENPALLARNVNWALEKFGKESESKSRREARMVRTLDGTVRAFLGSKYRRLDCYDLLEAVFPTLEKHKLVVETSEITEQKMYIQCIAPQLESEVKKGDGVFYGLTISSSDVGAGAVRVEPLVYRLVCKNGLIMPVAMKKYHAGKEQASDDVYEVLSDETRELTDRAFWNQVRDIVEHSLKPETFHAEVARLREAALDPIRSANIESVVELSMRAVNVGGEQKKNSIVAALARGADGAGLTKWGLMNAFTEVAQAPEINYDESVHMQRAAGKILELSPRDWKRVAEAV